MFVKKSHIKLPPFNKKEDLIRALEETIEYIKSLPSEEFESRVKEINELYNEWHKNPDNLN